MLPETARSFSSGDEVVADIFHWSADLAPRSGFLGIWGPLCSFSLRLRARCWSDAPHLHTQGRSFPAHCLRRLTRNRLPHNKL